MASYQVPNTIVLSTCILIRFYTELQGIADTEQNPDVFVFRIARTIPRSSVDGKERLYGYGQILLFVPSFVS